ncbi:MAG: hydrogenase formation protein HypD [Clostridia bacterium]|nr:hydrogenase formation protein HypD [Clostridia bacterium]
MTDLQSLIDFLKKYDGEPVRIMEICGTHTAAISENGIPEMLSPKIKLISGPGCPVCVTVSSYIDKLTELSTMPNTCVVTFGDMLRVCGSKKSLSEAKAEGGNVKMVYSPFDIINMAKEDLGTTYIFGAVGFETTTPIYALLVKQITEENIKNIKLLTAIKTMPAVIEALSANGIEADGFIAPGHVSVITGSKIFEPLAKKYNLPFVVSGFEGKDLIEAIYTIVKSKGKGKVVNLYTEAVLPEGNEKSRELTDKYFMPYSASWRGLGLIENSGLVLRDEYRHLDGGSYDLVTDCDKLNGCRCKDVVCGKIAPTECKLFGKICNPQSPQGACMVSMEGSCFNYFVNKRV